MQVGTKHLQTALLNHSFSHWACSEVSVDSFINDVQQGALLTRPLAQRYGKSLRYFRFPYNNLGRDSAHQYVVDCSN